jgi:hypothetical protein
MMTDDQAPAVQCAGCGARLRPHDVVIESREIVPSWTVPGKPATTLIFHKGCEFDGGRADHDWTREVPRTLSHVLLITRSQSR